MQSIMTDLPVPLSDPGLPSGWGPWDLPAGWKRDERGGPGGRPALCLERKNAAEYLNARLRFPLTPGRRYRLSACIQLTDAPGGKASAHAGIEFFDSENRYLGGGHLPAVLVPGAWVEGEAEFTVPRYTAECRLMFYLRAGAAGTARFADPVIGPAPLRWAAYPLTPVRDELPAEGGRVEFGCFVQGPQGPDAASYRCRVELRTPTACLEAADVPVAGDRFAVTFGQLPTGPARVHVTLLDDRGAVGETKHLPVTVVDEATRRERAAGGCVVDPSGRLAVRGRPLMPIGFYMGGIERNELAEIAGGPFNCLLPYGSGELRFADSKLQGVAAVREVLDACEEKGIKIIFCLAGAYDELAAAPIQGLGVTGGEEVVRTVIREFGKHPALLAWYINDEQPVERMPQLVARRRFIRGLDPYHPIYAVMCQVPELPFFTEMVDVYGIDPYPIVDPACDHIRTSRYAHDMAETALRTEQGMALWTVVQAHNIGAYDPKASVDPAFYREAYRDPAFDEILALALLAALRGARGFLFYSYPDLAHPAFDAAARPRRWENTRRAAQALRDLEPFLMSDEPVRVPELKVLEGEVEARAFRDAAGRECVLLVGIGPGPCRAELRLPDGPLLASQFGKTRRNADGLYCFEGHDVCADVLG